MQNTKGFYGHCIVVLSIVLLGFVIYQKSLDAPFQFDDILTIVENPSVKSLANISWIWFFDPSRFLTHLSFAFNYHFGGLNPRGYHLVNLFIHLLTTGVFYVFLKLAVIPRLKKSSLAVPAQEIAVFATMIFLSHPIQTQAVTYTAQRSTLLAAFFYLLSLVLYVAYRKEKGTLLYFLSILVACAGLFTKPIIITLPLAIILCEFFFFDLGKNPDKKRIWLNLIPFFLMIVVVPSLLVLWKYKAFDLNKLIEVTQETKTISRTDYALTQLNVLMFYLRLLVFPVGQNLDYDFPIARHFFSFPTGLSFLALAVIFFLAFRIYRNHRMIAFGIAWFFLALSLESSLFPISDVIFEHRLYLPMAGFAIVASVGFGELIRDRRRYILAAFSVITIFSVMTYQRNLLWGDRLGFLRDVVKKSPNKARAHNNLAIVYHDQNNLAAAEAEYKKAIALDLTYAHPHNNLGNIYMAQGRVPEAMNEFEQALKMDPKYDAPYYNLGNLYRNLGDLAQAQQLYEKGLKLKPAFAQLYSGLGYVYLRKGDLDSAETNFLKAIQLNPDFAYAYYGLGDVYLKKTEYRPALEAYLKAVRIKPTQAVVYNNIGNIYDMYQEYELAIEHYQAAIRINPQFANPYFNLANTLKKAKRFNEARETLGKALELYKQQNNKTMIEATQKRLRELTE